MILTNVRVHCDKYSAHLGRPNCSLGPVEFDHTPTDDELAEALAEAGYVTEDGRHLCTYHADAGEPFTVTGDWFEIALGASIRTPIAWDAVNIEVKRAPADDPQHKLIPREVPC